MCLLCLVVFSGFLEGFFCAGEDVEVVHARMQVLFVTCHDREPLEEMRGYVGQQLSIQTTAAGNVTWNLAEDAQLSANGGSAAPSSKPSLKMSIPKWSALFLVMVLLL